MARKKNKELETEEQDQDQEKDEFKELLKLLGDDFIVIEGGEFPEIPRIPFNIQDLDNILGGGIPKSKVIELFGEEGSGKTWLLIKLYAAAQQLGLRCCHFDIEQCFPMNFAKDNGVDLSRLPIKQPNENDCAETLLQKVEDICRTGKFDVIGIDSTAALTPREELEGSMTDQQMGLLARVMSRALRKLVNAAAQGNTIIVFINQLREKIGAYSPTGKPVKDTTGGKALKFYSSVRIEVSRKLPLKTESPDMFLGDQIVGHFLKCKIVKNRTAPPFGTCEIPLYYKPRRAAIQAMVDAESKDILVKNPKDHKKFKFGDVNIQILTKGDWEGLLEMVKDQGLFLPILNELGVKKFDRYIEDGDLSSEEVELYFSEKQ